jgi:hypothetical protein
MTAKTTRILKEARPLFWPWCAVILAGVLPLAHPPEPIGSISRIGFFLGIPLLATLSLGNEFQHRTLPLLLSQPIGRMEIWGEKLCVTVLAVLSAVLVFAFAWRVAALQPDLKGAAFSVVWIIATTAAATYWTIVARSTLGGVALNIAVHLFIIIVAFKFADELRGRGYLSPANTTAILAVTVLCYAGVMVWLGRRSLARFQVTGGMGGDDLLTAGPGVMPAAVAGWLRCQPTGAVLNLIRKEFRLLRPVWLVSLLAALGWACLSLFGLLHERGSSRNFETTVLILGVVSTLMIAILAGTVPLGEERTSGTHSWHLTLPVPARRQWLIKLFMALFAGFVGAGLVPLLIAGRLLGSSHMLADVHVGRDLLVGAVLLSFAAFWCACAVNGTVRAVLWVLPVMIALYFAGELGKSVGPVLTDLFFSRFDPFANLKFAKAVNSILDPELFYAFGYADWDSRYDYGLARLTLLWLPTLLLAAGQSYRLFRAEVRESALSLVRNLLPLAMVAFLCSFSLLAFFSFVGRAGDQKLIALFETIQAVETIQSGAAKLDAAHPLQLTVEDLAKASSLSKSTRRLLGNSHITLALEEAPHHGRDGCGENSKSSVTPCDQGYSWCLATIPLADGSHFAVTFLLVSHYLIFAGLSK